MTTTLKPELKSVKVRKSTPTQRQRFAIKLAKEHPDWTGRAILEGAGYRGWTLEQPGRVLSRPTAKIADAEHRATYRERVLSQLNPDKMADRHVAIATQDEERGVALRALERIMTECEVIKERDQAKIADAARYEQAAYLVGLLRGILTPEQEQTLADKLGADCGKIATVV